MIFEFVTIFVLLFIIIGLVYQFMYDHFTWVFVASLIFYISYVALKVVLHRKKKKEGQTEVQPAQKEAKPAEVSHKPIAIDPEIQKLQQFISKNLKEGFKEKIIRQALAKQGWPQEKVDKAFSSL